jgi:hypothetical protein
MLMSAAKQQSGRQSVDFYQCADPARFGRSALPACSEFLRTVQKKWASGAGIVIELGAGRGALKNVFEDYLGIDISERYFEVARERIQLRQEAPL